MAVQRSSYTQSEYRDRVRGDLGLRSQSLLTDAEINTWGRQAQKRVAFETHWLKKTSTAVNVVAGTSAYDWPTDAISISEVFHDGDPLRRFSLRDIARNNRTWRDLSGTPTSYYLLGMTSVGLHPNPDTNVTNGLTMVYSYLPANPANDADYYYVPTALDEALISYGKLMASLKDATGEGRDRIAYYRAEWEQYLRDIKGLVAEAAEGELTVLGADNDLEEGLSELPLLEVPV